MPAKDFLSRMPSASIDLNAANKDGDTALIFAAGKGDTAIIDALVNAGSKDGDIVVVDINAENNDGWTALRAAISTHTALRKAQKEAD